MDWKLLFTVFISILLAEMGDKTQLAVLSCSGSSGKWLEVFLGSMLAFLVLTLTASILGSKINSLIDRKTVEKIAGALFILIGLTIILR